MMSNLEAIKTIEIQDWMKAPELIAVMQTLGGSDYARFVGGCVRNTLLNVPIKDVDIACKHEPETVIQKLKAAGFTVVPTGIDHGTVTVVTDSASYEVTTLRRDVETDGRRATVSFSTDWVEDAYRRDFTINALLLDIEGGLYDPTEQGVDDIKIKTLRFEGEAARRIEEDVLRILRYFRFSAEYDVILLDDALAACKDQAHKIKNLSKERITLEFLKILASDRAEMTLKNMHDHNVLPELTSVQAKHYNFEQLSCMAKLFCIHHDINHHEKFLRLSNDQKKEFKHILEATQFGSYVDAKSIKKAMYYHGSGAAKQAYLIVTQQPKTEDLDVLDNWNIPTFPITGADLIKQGYSQGPDLGQTLKALERAWVENDYKH